MRSPESLSTFKDAYEKYIYFGDSPCVRFMVYKETIDNAGKKFPGIRAALWTVFSYMCV